jgi:hypothetical protein
MLDFLPISQLTENIRYQTHITHFSVVSIAEIHAVSITRNINKTEPLLTLPNELLSEKN